MLLDEVCLVQKVLVFADALSRDARRGAVFARRLADDVLLALVEERVQVVEVQVRAVVDVLHPLFHRCLRVWC